MYRLKFLTKSKGYKQFSYFCLMKLLKQFFEFYLDASIHVALAGMSLLYATDILLNIPIDFHLNFFLFFATIGAYNFVKYGVEAEKYILVALRYHKNIQIFSIICLIFATYHLSFLPKNSFIFLFFMLLLTGLYAIPVLPHTKNLRNLGGLKIFIVALVWTGTTVIFPAITETIPISWDVMIETLQRFLLVLILLVPFEIRDLAYDMPELKTLPQRFGVTNTKIFALFAAVLFYGLSFLKDTFLMIDLIGKGILFLTLGLFILLTNRKQSKYFASFWVEAIPIFWFGVLLVLKNFF